MFYVRLAGDHLYGMLVMALMMPYLALSFFPRDVLDETRNWIESVPKHFPTYSCHHIPGIHRCFCRVVATYRGPETLFRALPHQGIHRNIRRVVATSPLLRVHRPFCMVVTRPYLNTGFQVVLRFLTCPTSKVSFYLFPTLSQKTPTSPTVAINFSIFK